MFHVNQGPEGPVKYLSPQWQTLVQHAISECDRLGLELAIHNCEGWSESGGPWVKPDQAMQKVVWSQARLAGGKKVTVNLPQPPTVRDCYHDIAVLAFPTLDGEKLTLADLHAKITASDEKFDASRIIDGANAAALPVPTKDKPQFIQIEIPSPPEGWSIASMRIGTRGANWCNGWQLLAGDDGKTFRKVCDWPNRPGTWATFAIRARFLKVVMPEVDRDARTLEITAIEVGPADRPHGRADRHDLRRRVQQVHRLAGPAADVDPARRHRRPHRPHGQDRPPGMGRPRGRLDHPADRPHAHGRGQSPLHQRGLRPGVRQDDAAAVEFHFNSMMAKVIAQAGPLAGDRGKGLTQMLCDSWEAGCENWTPLFPQEFKARWGYAPAPLAAGRHRSHRGQP